MPQIKKNHPKEKASLHPRNKHRGRYNFKALINSSPELARYVRINEYKDQSIDFSNPDAVMMLNKALLKHHYGIDHWQIPKGYLCPPIPGRADYIHYAADLLGSLNHGKIPKGKHIKCLDIGTGANCIYPILGHKEYGWSFTGSDIEELALQSASDIVEGNEKLKNNIDLRLQTNPKDIFRGIIKKGDSFDLTICNPPFHASYKEAQAGTRRKLNNLNQKKIAKTTLNFGGMNTELWCDGGEEKFVQNMVIQSKWYAPACLWFTSLLSKEAHLKNVYASLKKANAAEIRTIPMQQGNKVSRFVAWTFQSKEQQIKWVDEKWKSRQ